MTATVVQPTILNSEPLRRDTGLSCSAHEVTRIEKAKNLLLNPHYRLGEIAEHLGFRSITQFNRCFEHIAGQSPTAYRQMLGQPNIDAPGTRPTPMKSKSAPEKLKVLILYSDRISGHEAMRTCDHALKQLDKDHWFEFRLWRMDMLDQRDIRTHASRDVAAADMIVVTVDDERACSETFQRWARSWPAPQRGARRALVAFQPGGGAVALSASGCVDFLRELAAQRGMDLLNNHPPGASTPRAIPAQWMERSQESSDSMSAAEPRAEFARASLEETTPTYRRWGINE
ncbi:MAG: helix-turn-helix domain-containing protein [Verrucomicrobiales bacterium]|nr:helix-turn-helix domain-containing protein [Verrucomicrobiales bacterium]